MIAAAINIKGPDHVSAYFLISSEAFRSCAFHAYHVKNTAEIYSTMAMLKRTMLHVKGLVKSAQ